MNKLPSNSYSQENSHHHHHLHHHLHYQKTAKNIVEWLCTLQKLRTVQWTLKSIEHSSHSLILNKFKTTSPVLIYLSVTTFVCTGGSRTKCVWRLIEKANRADMEHPSLKKAVFFSGKLLIHVHPCFYRAVKMRHPLNFRELSSDDRVTSELATSTL